MGQGWAETAQVSQTNAMINLHMRGDVESGVSIEAGSRLLRLQGRCATGTRAVETIYTGGPRVSRFLSGERYCNFGGGAAVHGSGMGECKDVAKDW